MALSESGTCFVCPPPKLDTLFGGSDHSFFRRGKVTAAYKFSIMPNSGLPRLLAIFSDMTYSMVIATTPIFIIFFRRTNPKVFSAVVHFVSINVVAIIQGFKRPSNHSRNNNSMSKKQRWLLGRKEECSSSIPFFKKRPPIFGKIGIFFREEWLRCKRISFWHEKGRDVPASRPTRFRGFAPLRGNWLSCAGTLDFK